MTFGDQRHVKAGSAHVAGDNVFETRTFRDVACRNNPGRWTRQSSAHRETAGGADGHDTAIGLHDHELAIEPTGVQGTFQAIKVAGDFGLQVSVQSSGREPLELSNFRQDF